MYRFVCLLLLFLYACLDIHAQPTTKKKAAKPSFAITLNFENRVDTQLLSLDSTYTNPHGEMFTVRNFRYYLSGFSVTASSGKTAALPQSYFLIDERKPESKHIALQVPFQQISAISFLMGVDSIKNVSGVQTGALDPANGMFWTWNSGYIMAKLEGASPALTAPQNGFTYHIGGFRKGENALRKAALPLPQPMLLSKQKRVSIHIAANVNAWFAGNADIHISHQPSVMTPGPVAMQIADNYSRMFTVIP